MTTIFVSITGPGTAEELENGGREAAARAGYQIGDFTLEQDLGEAGICGGLDIEQEAWDDMEENGKLDLRWGDYRVYAEMP